VTRLADRQIEIVLRNKVYFGVDAIARLPEVIVAAGGSRVFVVTDPGVRASGVVDRALRVLAEAGVEHALFD
jgi:alcohol dehydrogenase class IV